MENINSAQIHLNIAQKFSSIFIAMLFPIKGSREKYREEVLSKHAFKQGKRRVYVL